MEKIFAKDGKNLKKYPKYMEKTHVRVRVKMQWRTSLKIIDQRPDDIFSII